MYAEDYRMLAWAKLDGKWGTMVLATLVYLLITGACSALSVYYIGGIASLLLGGPLALGLAILSLNVVRNEKLDFAQLFEGFRDFTRAFVLYLLMSVFVALWSLLFVIPGIIKMYSYSMSYYILKDHPELGPNEARKESMRLMYGNKWRLFCLHFSFIGWCLLSVLTLGILYLWVIPYMQTAEAEFYQSLLPKVETVETVETIADGTL